VCLPNICRPPKTNRLLCSSYNSQLPDLPSDILDTVITMGSNFLTEWCLHWEQCLTSFASVVVVMSCLNPPESQNNLNRTKLHPLYHAIPGVKNEVLIYESPSWNIPIEDRVKEGWTIILGLNLTHLGNTTSCWQSVLVVIYLPTDMKTLSTSKMKSTNLWKKSNLLF